MSRSDDKAAASAAMIAAGVAAAMIAQQVAGKAVRDAMFLSAYPTKDLPTVMIAAAALALVVVLLMSRAMVRFSPRVVAPTALMINAGLYALEWALAPGEPRVVAAMLYLHTAALGAAAVSGFWSLINERFDPHTAKKLVSRITAGATVGGVIGGVSAWQLSAAVDMRSMLVILGSVNIVAAIGAFGVGTNREHVDDRDAATEGALAIMRDTPYLRYMALLVALAAVGEAAMDYVLKASAAERFPDGQELVTFFALFHMGAGILTFVLQATVARKLLEGIGLAGAIAVLPGTVLATGIAALAAPGLWSISLMRGGSQSVESSLYRSGYELLYTPLPPAKKRPTKTLIDVGCSKLGGAAGSGLALVAVTATPMVTRSVLLGVALACSVFALLISRALQRGYVASLADSLRSGSIELGEDDVVDRTTRRTLADTSSINRSALLAEIEKLHSEDHPAISPVRAGGSSSDPTTRDIAELRSGDDRRIGAVLARGRLDPELAGHVIPLLERDGAANAACKALRPIADRITGQLLDALLDHGRAVAVRRRIPRVLSDSRNQRAVDGLVLGLGDERFAVRYRCAGALMRITAEHDALVDQDAIVSAIRNEARRSQPARTLDDELPSEEKSMFERESVARALGQRMIYFFTLLSLICDREPLQLAFVALGSDDTRVRGTGREYLENVVPTGLRAVLEPFLGDRETAKLASRPKQQVLDDLLASRDAMTLDPEILRKLRGL